jgi:hypothetical protein
MRPRDKGFTGFGAFYVRRNDGIAASFRNRDNDPLASAGGCV